MLEALMSGSDEQGLQRELWQITQTIFKDLKKRPEKIPEFIGEVLKAKPSNRLSDSLHVIMGVERLLVATNNLFHYCRRKDGAQLTTILGTLEGRYQYAHLPEILPEESFPRKESLQLILAAFQKGEMSRVLSEILMLNKHVMQQRSGAPWVETESGDTLRVKVKSEKADLRSQETIEQAWDYDYFIGSFLNIASHHIVHP
ncbi:MAG: hypothetical protein GY721_01515 [Deltaproteobacteria bacterium]|nr:hypothetical protein [Deltaproteobacteria bacterium]